MFSRSLYWWLLGALLTYAAATITPPQKHLNAQKQTPVYSKTR
ncbi:MAG: hypothetical protein AAGJ35_00335 [Myxococcota bacterium]